MEDEEEEKQVSEVSTEGRDPNHNHPHRHLNFPVPNPSDLPPELDEGWSISDLSVVFPPVNHEGLHGSSASTPTYDVDDRQQLQNPFHSPPVDDEEEGVGSVPAAEARVQAGSGVDATSWWHFGFSILRSKVKFVASSLRQFAAFGGTNWSFLSGTGMAVMLLFWWLYVAVRRRRQNLRLRTESLEYLVLLLKEKDEKISQLLNQIAQMNQVLLALHGDSSSRSKKTTT